MTMAKQVSDTHWSMLERWLAGEIPIDEFETWVYAQSNLESALGPDDALALLSADFRAPHARIQIDRLILETYNRHRPGLLARDRARRLAAGLVDGTLDVVSGVQKLAQLYTQGNAWIPVIFVSIDSDFGEVPKPEQYQNWEEQALAAKLEKLRPVVEGLRLDAITAARALLEGELSA
jgi:hypothetical protein